MKLNAQTVQFGWGGRKPLPKPQDFVLPKPTRFQAPLAEEVARRLSDTTEDSARFVVLAGQDAPKWFKGKYAPGCWGAEEANGLGLRTPIARFLEKVSKAFARQQLQKQDATNQVMIADVSYWPGHIAPTDWTGPTTAGQIGALQFNAEKIPSGKLVQIADLRQFCRDKGLEEKDLFEPVKWMGMRLKPAYQKEIAANYTVEINAKNVPGKDITVLMNRSDQLYFRYADEPGNYFENGTRRFRHFLLAAFPFKKGELHPSVEKQYRDNGTLIELPTKTKP